MRVLGFVLVCAAFVALAQADCPMSQNPRNVIECIRYITSGLYGAAVRDLRIICNIAADIAVCASRELGDCVAAEIGRAALKEVQSLAENCCPTRNTTRCPIRDSVLSEQRCFATDALVTLSNRQHKLITDLQPGDAVLAFDDATKQLVHTHVLTMLHFDPHQFALFKHITTRTGRHLSLTPAHLLPTVTHGFVMAKHLLVGMSIYVVGVDGTLSPQTVTNVTDEIRQGFIAPLTNEGTLIVDGVAASCYGTLNSHRVAHGALAPMRWWYGVFGTAKASQDEASGLHWFPEALYKVVSLLMPSVLRN